MYTKDLYQAIHHIFSCVNKTQKLVQGRVRQFTWMCKTKFVLLTSDGQLEVSSNQKQIKLILNFDMSWFEMQELLASFV